MFENVIVGVDGGEGGRDAITLAKIVDLHVLGSRDYGPLGRLVHGSTTHKLARTARSPLLVLTRAARESEANRAAAAAPASYRRSG